MTRPEAVGLVEGVMARHSDETGVRVSQTLVDSLVALGLLKLDVNGLGLRIVEKHNMIQLTSADSAAPVSQASADSNSPLQIDFVNACRAAAERLWHHRKNLHRVMVRIGYWPDGLIISAVIPVRSIEELHASQPPRVIPWSEVATITEARLIGIVDELCDPLYGALGIAKEKTS